MTPTYTATIGKASHKIRALSNQQVEVDEKLYAYSLVELGSRSFSLILGGKTYTVELLSVPETSPAGGLPTDGQLRHLVALSIKGAQYNVRVDDERSLLLRSFLTKAQTTSTAQVIRAPMPGLISRIEVQIGQEVPIGKGLLVLEAMKMENEIRSLIHGRIKVVHVERGKAVEKGEPLVTIEGL